MLRSRNSFWLKRKAIRAGSTHSIRTDRRKMRPSALDWGVHWQFRFLKRTTGFSPVRTLQKPSNVSPRNGMRLWCPAQDEQHRIQILPPASAGCSRSRTAVPVQVSWRGVSDRATLSLQGTGGGGSTPSGACADRDLTTAALLDGVHRHLYNRCRVGGGA